MRACFDPSTCTCTRATLPHLPLGSVIARRKSSRPPSMWHHRRKNAKPRRDLRRALIGCGSCVKARDWSVAVPALLYLLADVIRDEESRDELTGKIISNF